MIYFFNFQNSIRSHVWHRVFETLQIKLYRAVEYDSKWSPKIQKDCMLDVFVISLLRRLLIFLKLVLGPMSSTRRLQHSKL